MKVNTKSAKATENKANEAVKLNSIDVQNVRAIDTQRGTMVLFTLIANGIAIYSCRVASGSNGDFVSFPQYKGKDGKYWNYAYYKLTAEDNDYILQLVQDALNK